MKIISSLFFLLFACVYAAHAQDYKWTMGAEGGPSITGDYGFASNFFGQQQSLNLYFSAGFTGQYYFNEGFSLNTALQYEKKGVSITIVTTDNNGQPNGTIFDSKQLNYLVVPILLRYEFGNTCKLFVNGGPYFGYLVQATGIIKSDDPLLSENSTHDVTSTTNRFDMGLSAGVGLDAPLSSRLVLSFEACANLGLPIFAINPSGHYLPLNETVELLVGIKYRIGENKD